MRDSIGRMLNDIFRQKLEFANGRLHRYPNLWRWAINVPSDVQTRLDNGEERVILRDGKRMTGWFEVRDGRVAELATGECVICPNVELWPDAFPYKNKAKKTIGRWVRMSACRKCEHYRTAKQTRARYSSCDWAKTQRTAGQSAGQTAVKDVIQIIDSAEKLAKEWL